MIEIDGDSHYDFESVVEDQERQKILEDLGLVFLRFSDLDVKKKMPWVLSEISFFIDEFEDSVGIDRTSF